ncbi:hypothetical protein SAOR_14910 [Salinisphaera orenii MK-B5]|uniref:MxaK protein n=2 Tax=Salinisphaera orenii TaxID=856731 RepID=A0A423PFW6_9GAMM|nr:MULTISPECIES: hypothetical protein [Salinisphaera]ROO24482.1 hypothetical protein SAOR_14910 [Salinisphaera orenii MK-B5]ROO27886.1 hypothetical protein SAHL_11120 [Salinisphaera halophila YIM 95161]
MSRRRILGWLVLAAAAVATSVSVWQAALWYGHSRDNDAIRNALAHESGDVTPQSPLPVLFAQGYAESKLDRYREAGAAYQTIWIRTDGGTRGDPEGLAAKTRYNLGNLYVQRAVAAADEYDIDGARTMAELAKQAYRDALRADPGYWAAKHNFEAAQRLVRDLPVHEGEPQEGEKPAEEVWSQMPGFPRGAP